MNTGIIKTPIMIEHGDPLKNNVHIFPHEIMIKHCYDLSQKVSNFQSLLNIQ